MEHIFFIKNMVCDRCIFVVTQIFHTVGIEPVSVTLGEVKTVELPTEEQLAKLKQQISEMGFELLVEPDEQMVSQIKTAIIDLVHRDTNQRRINLSDLLADSLCCEYSKLSKLFSEHTGTTIEQYYIAQRIERVKELMHYEEYTLSEIADKLYYSSVAHLSAQFKMVTGFTPTVWRKNNAHRRTPLDKV